MRSKHRCLAPGCRELVDSGRCARHAAKVAEFERQRQREVDARRPAEVRGVYSTPEWKKARARFLAKHPHCVRCGRQGRYVDHVRPWRTGATPEERDRLFWDVANWQPLCASHHSEKTARFDGGFGNARAVP